MELTKGLVVRALAGQDMGNFSWCCRWTADMPSSQTATAEARFSETKNLRHLQRTDQFVELDGVTDKKLRNVLKQYQACD